MGVLSDLVVAPEGHADLILAEGNPSRAFGGIDIKGIDTVKFGTLHSILTGRSFEELLPEYDPVATASEEGPWVFRIPPELVSLLAGLQGPEKDRVARQWASTEEFELSGWDATEVAEALDSIGGLARQSVEAGAGLF